MEENPNVIEPKTEQDVATITRTPVPAPTENDERAHEQNSMMNEDSNEHHQQVLDFVHQEKATVPSEGSNHNEEEETGLSMEETNQAAEMTTTDLSEIAAVAAAVAAPPPPAPTTSNLTPALPKDPETQGTPTHVEGAAAAGISNHTDRGKAMEAAPGVSMQNPEGTLMQASSDGGSLQNGTEGESSMQNDEDDDDEDDQEYEDDRILHEDDPRSSGDYQPPKKRRRRPRPMKPFNDMLYELLAFRAREGHCRVPLDSKNALGRWVQNLRTQKSNLRKGYHSLDLTAERLAVLDSIGFVWDLIQFDSDARWKRQFEELCAFKAEHGHCNVPQSTPLGKWVKMQRENYRETQLKLSGQLPSGRSKPRPTLSQFRIEQLESLGFNWKVAAPVVGWEHRFQEMLEYRRQHGDCNVPQAWPENRQLGRWVMKQRCQYALRQKGERNQLTDERVQRLTDLGFSWTAPSFRKKKESGRDFPSGAPVPHSVGQPPQLMPPGGHHHHPLPPHDFRRWV